jgi:hypothetical protein
VADDRVSWLGIGALGAGFSEDSLAKGIERKPDFIGADCGSVDGGPFALAGRGTNFPDANCERDLNLLVKAGARAGIPVLFGSSGSSGRDWGVDLFADMVRRTAKEEGVKLKMARVYAEIPKELVLERMRAGRLHAIEPAPPYDEDAVNRSLRIVGVMGAEAFQAALDQGADVVVAGRCTDTAIFSAIPLARGFDPGLAWHAGKISECGSSCAEPRRRLDVLHVDMRRDHFLVEPLASDIRCTPFSVAAHQLHEVSDPFELVEPGWITDMSNARYEAASDRAVRVSGTTAVAAPYTIKLEGVESVGFHRMFMLSLRDPTILENLDGWLDGVKGDIEARAEELLGKGALEQSETHFRIYGRDGTMGAREPVKEFEGHEAFVLADLVAPDARSADMLASIIWYAYLHAKSPGWRGGTTVAWQFNPPVFDLGEAFKFNVHHAIEVDDPLETVRIEMEELG